MHAPLLFYPDARDGHGAETISDDGRPMMLPPAAEIHRAFQGNPRNTVARYLWITSEDGRVWIAGSMRIGT